MWPFVSGGELGKTQTGNANTHTHTRNCNHLEHIQNAARNTLHQTHCSKLQSSLLSRILLDHLAQGYTVTRNIIKKQCFKYVATERDQNPLF